MLSHTITHDGTHVFHSAASNAYLSLSASGTTVSPQPPAGYARDTATAASAVLGTIKLKINKYLVVADKHEVTGSVVGHSIGKVTLFKIYALGNDSISKKDPEETQYLGLLNEHLGRATLFFSIDGQYDLTNLAQRQLGVAAAPARDARFWWNQYLCSELEAAGAAAFVTPVIYGYAKSHTAYFKGHQALEFALVTRRAVLRAGTRYFRRGVDDDGHVANFNETEQIFTTADKQVYALVQTRGSVPVFWLEINNLKYKPNLLILSRSAQSATTKHFEEQVAVYGENFLVNLVNQKGYEKPVKDAYQKAVEFLPQALALQVHYLYFDFHHECRKMRWDRVKLLLEHLVVEGYSSSDYFHYDVAHNTVMQSQRQVVRTNCMDCLDRTNVVQLMVARWVLQTQLEQAHYLPPHNSSPWERLDPNFNLVFQSFWADNADAVSCSYSGTGALKTDYTRTGKRTKVGALKDLVNSVTRYYLNNYKDGLRQDSYDLFLGKYRPYRDAIANPFVDRRSPYVQLLPYLVGALFLVFVALLLYPTGLTFLAKNLLFLGGCLYFGAYNTRYIVKNGYQFVNWPLLVPLDFLKKTEEFNVDGKLMGIRFEESEHFRTSKKRN